MLGGNWGKSNEFVDFAAEFGRLFLMKNSDKITTRKQPRKLSFAADETLIAQIDAAARATRVGLRELLHYEPETGVWTWRVRPANCMRVGDIAGTDHIRGYRAILIARRQYLAHRLAWLYMTGAWPREIDHIDCNKANNCWANLREATHSQNVANIRRRRDNTSGLKGVCWHRAHNCWGAYITIKGKQRHLGYFDTSQEAGLTRATVSYGAFGEFANPHWREVLADMRGVRHV
jgi:hypothetical protein